MKHSLDYSLLFNCDFLMVRFFNFSVLGDFLLDLNNFMSYLNGLGFFFLNFLNMFNSLNLYNFLLLFMFLINFYNSIHFLYLLNNLRDFLFLIFDLCSFDLACLLKLRTSFFMIFHRSPRSSLRGSDIVALSLIFN